MRTLALFSSLANASQFTGIEQTRIGNLLAILTLISVAMWAAVSISIIARVSVKLIFRRLQKKTLASREP